MKKCYKHFEFIFDFDLFGKYPEFYFKGKPQRTSLFGKILTYIYIILYLVFFVYKIIRMIKKVDITFYETYAYSEIPSIQLSSDNFYGGFAVGGMIEETLYYPKAYFYRGHRVEGDMQWEEKEIEIDICKLEYFGAQYQEIFKDKKLSNYYCLKNVNELTLEGYASLESYSYIYIAFFPCVGISRDGRACQNDEIIDNFFKINYVEFKMQDIELTPHIYDTPSIPKEKDISSPVYRHLLQQIYAYLQIVILETDQDMIGFEGLSNIKTEKFLKYEESWIIAAPTPHSNSFDPSKPVVDVTIQLSAKVLTQKRKKTKLIEVLGDVGGLMEFIWSILTIISTVITDILYDKALINNLFSFNLDDKKVIIKKKDNLNIIPLSDRELKNSSQKTIILPQSSTNMKYDIFQSPNKLNEEKENKNLNEKTIEVNVRKKKKKKSSRSNIHYIEDNNKKNNNLKSPNNINDMNSFGLIPMASSSEKIINYKEISIINKNENKNIISHIKLNNFCIYFWFCFVRKKKNIQNILLDEGMNVINRQLDILNIFRILHKDEIIQENIQNKEDIFEMSETCKHNLKVINHPKYN